MAIRVSHSGAPAPQGMAAYSAGSNISQQRKKKQMLDMWQEERRAQQRRGNIYRSAMGGRRAQQQLGQQQGTWVDPLQEALSGAAAKKAEYHPFGGGEEDTGNMAVQIKSQRQANARAQRMGKPLPYPQAEAHYEPPLTKEQIEKKKWDRNVEREDTVWARNQEQKTKDTVNQRTFEISKGNFEDVKKRFYEIDPGDPLAWRDTNRRDEYKRIKRMVETGNQDQQGQRQYTPTEYHNEAARAMGGFLEGHQPNHLIPKEERVGNTYTTDDGIKFLVTPDGGREFQGFVDEGPLTREQVDRGMSKNYRRNDFLGTYEQRVWGKYGVEWQPVKMPESSSPGQVYNEWAANYNKSYDNFIKENNYDGSNAEHVALARAHASKLWPKPPEIGGEATPAAAGAQSNQQPPQGQPSAQPAGDSVPDELKSVADMTMDEIVASSGSAASSADLAQQWKDNPALMNDPEFRKKVAAAKAAESQGQPAPEPQPAPQEAGVNPGAEFGKWLKSEGITMDDWASATHERGMDKMYPDARKKAGLYGKWKEKLPNWRKYWPAEAADDGADEGNADGLEQRGAEAQPQPEPEQQPEPSYFGQEMSMQEYAPAANTQPAPAAQPQPEHAKEKRKKAWASYLATRRKQKKARGY